MSLVFFFGMIIPGDFWLVVCFFGFAALGDALFLSLYANYWFFFSYTWFVFFSVELFFCFCFECWSGANTSFGETCDLGVILFFCVKLVFGCGDIFSKPMREQYL